MARAYLLTKGERSEVQFYIKHGPPTPTGCKACRDLGRIVEKIRLDELQKDISLLQTLLQKVQKEPASE